MVEFKKRSHLIDTVQTCSHNVELDLNRRKVQKAIYELKNKRNDFAGQNLEILLRFY